MIFPSWDSFYFGIISLEVAIEYKMAKANLTNSQKDRKIGSIPACYEDSYALDREHIQTTHGLSKEEVISKHTCTSYYAYYIGFMPGFPYLGDIDPSLITPRLATPRIQIPARSIGIAKEHTCVYPKVSPGGWNIIGQVPFDIFSLEHSRTSLFLPGDTVQFQSISEKEFLQIQSKHLAFDEIIKEFSKWIDFRSLERVRISPSKTGVDFIINI